MTLKTFNFTTDIEIRFADIDAYGHVNNAIFFTYLETARIKLFQQFFGGFLDTSLTFLVVRAECDYRLPVKLNDRLQITIVIEQLRHSSFTFGYRLHNGEGKDYATARTVMVCFDPVASRPVAIPAEIRALFAA